mgnify:CR=1 FL=1
MLHWLIDYYSMFQLDLCQDLIINKMSVSRIDAIKYFKKEKQIDKANVLKYISNTYVNLYRIDEKVLHQQH